MTTPPAEVRATLVKIVALLAFIVAADLWATHHFGLGLVQLVAVGGIVALVSAILPLIKSALSSDQQKGIATVLRDAGGFVLVTPVLVFLYVAGAITALTVSSVTVMSDGPEGADWVSITYPDRPGDTATGSLRRDSVVRVRLFTTPFGRPIRVAAQGFVPASFTVPVLTGLTVWLGRDLPVAPSVLFRPERRALAALRNGGTFRAWVEPRTDATAVIAETSFVMSSFIVGEPLAIPGAMLEDWRLELACDTADVRNRILLAWKRPVLLARRAASPGPDTRLLAEVRAKNGDLVARTDVVLGADRLIDVPVFDVEPNPGACR